MLRRKPMNRQGKGAARTKRSNAKNKKRFIKDGIDCCQLCGRTGWLSNSHSVKADRRDEDAVTALLCTKVCHTFLELKCTAQEREAINKFLIETTLEGEHKLEKVVQMLPVTKAEELVRQLNRS